MAGGGMSQAHISMSHVTHMNRVTHMNMSTSSTAFEKVVLAANRVLEAAE
jgi:hypothetical protein